MRVLVPLSLSILARAAIAVAAGAPASPQSSSIVLTNAAQIRQLPPSETIKALPVSISGVVIDKADPNQQAIILNDNGVGIYVRPGTNPNIFARCHRGDLLQIKGVTDPGQFAPIIVANAVEKKGVGKIPPARPVTYQQLITGALDAQWVEVKGVVRECYRQNAGSAGEIIVIAADGGLLPVGLFTPPEESLQVDAEVSVRAIGLYRFDQTRQALTPILQVPRGEPVSVEKPAPANPFDIPPRSVQSLLLFSPNNLYAYAHRVHVRGIVTYFQPGEFVWIRDGNVGLCIQTAQQQTLLPGDELDVLGFPNFGSYPLVLEDSIFKKIGSTAPLTPLTLTRFDDAFAHENDLVAMDGILTLIQPVVSGVTLTLTKDSQTFKAFLRTSPGDALKYNWEAGSKVRVTGICSLAFDDTRAIPGIVQPKSFQIVLRSPADLAVLVSPPWWTLKHVAMLLALAICILVILIALVMASSRRRLQENERERKMAEAQFAAVLSERNRMARELHDTLAQGLVVTSVHLRLIKKFLNGASPAAVSHLEAAQQLVSDSLQESRDSIWNMRAHVLENKDLPTALKDILTQMSGGMEVKATFEILGRSRRLAPVVENNILRIGQEAISNAIKHSGATSMSVKLDFQKNQFRLFVADNGRGFDPANPPASEGGFGLIGMRERAVELKGQLDIHSRPGQGAECVLSIPISTE